MPGWAWILVAVVVVLVIGGIAWTVYQQRRTRRLKDRFGPEYDRTMAERGGRRQAESELAGRQRRREKLEIRPLDPASRERHLGEWRTAQTRFVDDPSGAIQDADRLVIMVMQERGYPMDDFDQRSADISVDHPRVVDDYRAAHAISMANEHGQASTEDLRQGMVHYRLLFETLLETETPEEEQQRGVG